MTTERASQSNIPPAHPLSLAGLVEYGEGAVVSRTLLKNDAVTITLFAFDTAQGLSEHATPFDALVQIVEGKGEFEIGGEKFRLGAGQIILMPANIPHAVRAEVRFKMLLTMFRTS